MKLFEQVTKTKNGSFWEVSILKGKRVFSIVLSCFSVWCWFWSIFYRALPLCCWLNGCIDRESECVCLCMCLCVLNSPNSGFLYLVLYPSLASFTHLLEETLYSWAPSVKLLERVSICGNANNGRCVTERVWDKSCSAGPFTQKHWFEQDWKLAEKCHLGPKTFRGPLRCG